MKIKELINKFIERIKPKEDYKFSITTIKFIKPVVIFILWYIASNDEWASITLGSITLALMNYLKFNWNKTEEK